MADPGPVGFVLLSPGSRVYHLRRDCPAIAGRANPELYRFDLPRGWSMNDTVDLDGVEVEDGTTFIGQDWPLCGTCQGMVAAAVGYDASMHVASLPPPPHHPPPRPRPTPPPSPAPTGTGGRAPGVARDHPERWGGQTPPDAALFFSYRGRDKPVGYGICFVNLAHPEDSQLQWLALGLVDNTAWLTLSTTDPVRAMASCGFTSWTALPVRAANLSGAVLLATMIASGDTSESGRWDLSVQRCLRECRLAPTAANLVWLVAGLGLEAPIDPVLGDDETLWYREAIDKLGDRQPHGTMRPPDDPSNSPYLIIEYTVFDGPGYGQD